MRRFFIIMLFVSKLLNAQVIASYHCGNLYYNTHVAKDSLGNIYVSEPLNDRIKKIDVVACTTSVIAGTGTPGYSGDGGLAIAAQLENIWAIVLWKGNLFVADYSNNVVRKINLSSGIITTAVGTGVSGYSGDGGQASQARLSLPSDLFFDFSGNMYICEQGNHCVRFVDVNTGIITTVAGNGTWGFSGDGGPATSAQFNSPQSLILDTAGNLYVGDQSNYRIRKVDAVSGVISTVVGTGANTYGGDGGLAVNAIISSTRGLTLDKQGNLYFTDTWNNRIRKVDAVSGIINTIAGTGSSGYTGDRGYALNARIDQPEDMLIDTLGNIIFADRGNNAIRLIYNCAYPSMVPTFALIQDSQTPSLWHGFPNYPITADSAVWHWGDGTVGSGFYLSHTYSVAATYSVCVTVYSVCGDSATYCLVNSMGVNDSIVVTNNNNPNNPLDIIKYTENQFSVYPNPATDILNVETRSGGIGFKIIDIVGNIVKQQGLFSEKAQVNTCDLQNGIYFIRVKTPEGTLTKKIIVQR